MSYCPECEAAIDEEFEDLGEVISCPECGVELEVISIDPVEFDLAPVDDEDEDRTMTIGSTKATRTTRTTRTGTTKMTRKMKTTSVSIEDASIMTSTSGSLPRCRSVAPAACASHGGLHLPQHIRLLVFDLDYLVFDCSLLKVSALRQSLISFAEAIPQSTRLPDEVDAEEGFLQHGFRWLQFLEIGLDEERLEEVRQAYRVHEDRLIEAGAGKIYPGLPEFLAGCRLDDVRLALGADASRDYLLSVSDRYGLHGVFDVALCTEEYGVGRAQEMLEDIMYQAEVNPSETLVLGTRPSMFEAAHSLDVGAVGCGWGIHQRDGLREADLQALSIGQLPAAIREADDRAEQYLG